MRRSTAFQRSIRATVFTTLVALYCVAGWTTNVHALTHAADAPDSCSLCRLANSVPIVLADSADVVTVTPEPALTSQRELPRKFFVPTETLARGPPFVFP